MQEQRYSISKAAKKTGLTVHTLRYYEKEGLLPFVERTESGLRSFKDDDFTWLNVIKCLKNTGMPIKKIKVFIDWCMDGDSTLEKRLMLFRKQKETVEAQMAELNGYLKTIEHKITYYEAAVEAGTESVHWKQSKLCDSGE
jgi:DNA-binding transcriptional MerR regulator